MFLEQPSIIEKAGQVIGFLAAYALFTGVLFWVFSVMGKGWPIVQVILLTGSIYLLGSGVKLVLR